MDEDAHHPASREKTHDMRLCREKPAFHFRAWKRHMQRRRGPPFAACVCKGGPCRCMKRGVREERQAEGSGVPIAASQDEATQPTNSRDFAL